MPPPPRRRRVVVGSRRLPTVAEAGDGRVERRLREHDPVVEEHVVGVELLGQQDLHALAEVAQRLPHGLLGAEQHEQQRGCARAAVARSASSASSADVGLAHVAQPEASSSLTPALVFGSVDAPVVDDDDLALGGAVGQRAAQREADHLLGRALRVVAGLGTVRHTAAAPLRRADRALAGPAGALLAPRLGAAAAHLGARLGAVRARPLGGELRGDHLVHHRDVGLDAEDRRRAARRSHPICAVGLLHRQRGPAHAFTPAFTALRTNTRPLVAPGTEPLMSSSPRSASPSTTSRFSVVTSRVAELAGHLHALEHAGRRRARADRAGCAVLLVVSVRRALAGEVVALHDAGEAAALADAGDVDPLAGREHVGRR